MYIYIYEYNINKYIQYIMYHHTIYPQKNNPSAISSLFPRPSLLTHPRQVTKSKRSPAEVTTCTARLDTYLLFMNHKSIQIVDVRI